MSDNNTKVGSVVVVITTDVTQSTPQARVRNMTLTAYDENGNPIVGESWGNFQEANLPKVKNKATTTFVWNDVNQAIRVNQFWLTYTAQPGTSNASPFDNLGSGTGSWVFNNTGVQGGSLANGTDGNALAISNKGSWEYAISLDLVDPGSGTHYSCQHDPKMDVGDIG
ncbi:MAG TPA: hypothetical protein VF720_02490 [Candidatus Eisenbacteria bacterium]